MRQTLNPAEPITMDDRGATTWPPADSVSPCRVVLIGVSGPNAARSPGANPIDWTGAMNY